MDEEALAEDLASASKAARAAIEPDIRSLEADGVPVESLRPCEAEEQDGTQLAGCVKRYIRQPDGRWGALFSIDRDEDERHPDAPWKSSVYEIAHRRFNR